MYLRSHPELDPDGILSSEELSIALAVVGALLALLAAGAILSYVRKKKKRENGGEGDACETPPANVQRAAVLPQVGGDNKRTSSITTKAALMDSKSC